MKRPRFRRPSFARLSEIPQLSCHSRSIEKVCGDSVLDFLTFMRAPGMPNYGDFQSLALLLDILDWQEAEDLLLQLRIHFVCDGHDVRKQLAEFHATLIPVQRRKNADLQDSGFIYDHCSGIALFESQLSVVTSRDRNRSFRSFAKTQPGDHVMEESRKMAGAFFEIQRDAEQVWFFFHEPDPLMNQRVEFCSRNVRHGFCICRSRRGLAAVHR
jgi:hypothetical protein